MNLGQRTLAIVALTVIGLTSMLYLVERALLLRSYLELERQETNNDMTRSQALLNDEISDLERTTNDYGAWDRTYDFMSHPTKNYINQEFKNDTLEGLRVNGVLLSKISGEIIFSKFYDSVRNVEVTVPKDLQVSLMKDPWVQNVGKKSAASRGVVLLPHGPVMIVACPILTSDRGGPVRGILVMTRYLDDVVVRDLRKLSGTSFDIQPIADLPTGVREAVKNGNAIFVQPLDKNTVAGYSVLQDIHGKEILFLKVELPRSVLNSGLASLRYLLFALCTLSIVFGSVTLLLLHRAVLVRLTTLSTDVDRIGAQDNPAERVRVDGSDEIARLGSAINKMLESVAKSASLSQMNEALRKEMQERLLAERAREEIVHLTAMGATVGAALTKANRLETGLQQCAEAFVEYLEVSCASVWTFDTTTQAVKLEASAERHPGMFSRSWDPPVCMKKIDWIARTGSSFLTNDVAGDPDIASDPYVKQEGVFSFVGQPLILDGHVVGVLAAFGHKPMTKKAQEALVSVADQIAQFIRRIQIQKKLHSSEEHFRELFTTIPIPIWLKDGASGRFLEVNEAAVKCYGYSRKEFLQMTTKDVEVSNNSPEQNPDILGAVKEGCYQCKHQTKSGRHLDVEISLHTIDFASGQAHLVAIRDVTERNQMEVELRHRQKLSAVGGLAAGVAHEINTPIQFVSDNVSFVGEMFPKLNGLLQEYELLYAAASNGKVVKALLEGVEAARQQADLEFLRPEIPRALNQAVDGIKRVAMIVRALKTFSRVDTAFDKSAADLNEALESTLMVAQNELKHMAEVETDFGELPQVVCYPGDLNQVFLALLVNAAHSIGDVFKISNKKGFIRVRTRVEAKPDGAWVVIAISDTGTGIPEEIRDRIFEPFFTTKDVDRGSGQGLALARAIVVEKHGGSITFESAVGKGTTFFLQIPVNGVGGQAQTSLAVRSAVAPGS